MASFTSGGWATGATVSVYLHSGLTGEGASPFTGSALMSGIANSAGAVTFSGLSGGVRHAATDGSRVVSFIPTEATSGGGSTSEANTWTAAQTFGAGTPTMKVDPSTGRVGIGTATPAHQLDVAKTIANYPANDTNLIKAEGRVRGARTVADRVHGSYSLMLDQAAVANRTVTAATNASPIAVTTSVAHGWATGDRIVIYEVLGNTAANGAWAITVTGTTTFTLDGSTGNGAYTSGGVATDRPMYYGFMSAVYPRLARGGMTSANAGNAANADDVNCYAAFNSGLARATDAFYLGRNSSIAGDEWITGFTIDAACLYGIRVNGPISATGGAIDTMAATIASGGFALRLGNQNWIKGRNAAGTADIQMMSLSAADEIHIGNGQNVYLNSPLRMQDGRTIQVGTTSGTKIGTATSQKLGFYNATPVVQPSGTPAAATDLATVITLANDLRTKLIALGLVA